MTITKTVNGSKKATGNFVTLQEMLHQEIVALDVELSLTLKDNDVLADQLSELAHTTRLGTYKIILAQLKQYLKSLQRDNCGASPLIQNPALSIRIDRCLRVIFYLNDHKKIEDVSI